jgi:hypothetical protein
MMVEAARRQSEMRGEEGLIFKLNLKIWPSSNKTLKRLETGCKISTIGFEDF